MEARRRQFPIPTCSGAFLRTQVRAPSRAALERGIYPALEFGPISEEPSKGSHVARAEPFARLCPAFAVQKREQARRTPNASRIRPRIRGREAFGVRPACRRFRTEGNVAHECIAKPLLFLSNACFEQERGCVLQTSRSASAWHEVVLGIHALLLVLRTQPRSATK